MARSRFDVGDLFFPVEFRPVYFKTKNEGGSPGDQSAATSQSVEATESDSSTEEPSDRQERLIELQEDEVSEENDRGSTPEPDGQIEPISRYKAIVDCEREYVFKVVSESYELITNQEAVDIGKRAYGKLFPDASGHGDFKTLSVIAPSTRAHCHIDLVHESFNFSVWEQDVYRPYLRVTNSYNSTHALKYRIGFVRNACTNGVIFDDEVVDVNLPHTRSKLEGEDVSEVVELEANVKRLRELEENFVDYLKQLQEIRVPKLYTSPVAAHALDLDFGVDSDDKDRRKREREKAKAFNQEIQTRVDHYYPDLGPNAYAMFNVISDYATHREKATERLRINTFQRRTGDWIRDFIRQQDDPHFGLDSYVEEELEMFSTAQALG
ncbi:hypothetical protein GGP91_002915 [Salinibacter ruber]|uniref:DUF945 domain-containing protein n=1 Tax=Salinibacter ruber TaxID=146919 RepID=UPI002167C2AA|nr:DUF945 domain-containing protein [Salinibacter ruber]MCS3642268.1 hypothetical protein [Salinibacter ruber]MCS3830821.1 hypothetical protein [Salinibacter ruber]